MRIEHEPVCNWHARSPSALRPLPVFAVDVPINALPCAQHFQRPLQQSRRYADVEARQARGVVLPVEIVAYGKIAGKGSRTQGRRANGTIFTRPASKYEQPWTLAVAAAAAATGRTLPPPYRVQLTFYFARPVRPAHEWPSRIDIDKCERATLDGLVRGGVIIDDRHVVAVQQRKEWAVDGAERCEITVS